MTLYNSDFYTWTQTQAKTLKAGIWDALDIENLVEEIETWDGRKGKSYKTAWAFCSDIC